jgi:hypothetical protein
VAVEAAGKVVTNPTLAWDGTNVYVGYGLVDGGNYYGSCDKNANNDGTWASAAGYPYHTAALTHPVNATVCSAAADTAVLAVCGAWTAFALYWMTGGVWSSLYTDPHPTNYQSGGGLSMAACWSDGSVHLVRDTRYARLEYLSVTNAGVASTSVAVTGTSNNTGKRLATIAVDERSAPAYDVHIFFAMCPFSLTSSGGSVAPWFIEGSTSYNSWSVPGIYHCSKASTDGNFGTPALHDASTGYELVYQLSCTETDELGSIGLAYQVSPETGLPVQRFSAHALKRTRSRAYRVQDIVRPRRRRNQ